MAFAFAVFGVVVVPIGLKADLPQHRGQQRLMTAAPHGAFQLPGSDAPLHHQAGVQQGGGSQSLQQFCPIAGLADANGRAEVGRLDKAGIAQLILYAAEQLLRGARLAPELAGSHRHVGHLGQTGGGKSGLHGQLVHAHSRPQHP